MPKLKKQSSEMRALKRRQQDTDRHNQIANETQLTQTSTDIPQQPHDVDITPNISHNECVLPMPDSNQSFADSLQTAYGKQTEQKIINKERMSRSRKRTENSLSGLEREKNRQRMTSVRKENKRTSQHRKSQRAIMASLRKDGEYWQHETAQNKERMASLRKDGEYSQHETAQNKERMASLRKDGEYSEHEKAQNNERLASLRKDGEYSQHEKAQNNERLASLRKDGEYSQHEKAQNNERLASLRKDGEYSQHEKAQNNERLASLRKDGEYSQHEKAQNNERKAMLRKDSNFSEHEKELNSQRLKLRRLQTEYTTREHQKNAERIRVYRQDSHFAVNERAHKRSARSKKKCHEEPKKCFENKRQIILEQRKPDARKRKSNDNVDVPAPKSRTQFENQHTETGHPENELFVSENRQNVEKRNDDLAKKDRGKKSKNINEYKRLILEGPTCVCTSCGSLWFRKSVRPYNEEYLIGLKVKGVDKECLEQYCNCVDGIFAKIWICGTCYKSVLQGRVPRLSLGNGLAFPELPTELKKLTPLEERLVSPRIPFMQIRPLGVDRQNGLKGNVVNVPVEVSTTVSILPRSFSDAQTIQLKLKRKTCYRGHYLFETVRPHAVYDAAGFLVKTPLYQEHGVTTLAEDWLQEHPLEEEAFVVDPADRAAGVENQNDADPLVTETFAVDLADRAAEVEIQNNADPLVEEAFVADPADRGVDDVRAAVETQNNAEKNPSSRSITNKDNETSEKEIEEEEWDETLNDDPVNAGVDETLLDHDEAIGFAPGEGQRPLPVVLDKDCEELSFPKIYAGQRREKPETVSYTDVAKSEARRYDRRATTVPKLFFSYRKSEMIRLSGCIQTCLRKKNQNKSFTVRNILERGTVEDIVNADQGYHVLRPVRGSPPFWEQKKKELLAMVRQLGCPTFFFTLSAAETKWTELLVILFRILVHDDPDPEEIKEWTFMDKAGFIRDDPVTCARYFDHRFRALFNTVMRSSDGPFGEITDFFFRVEFQHRGSPHVHGLLWVKDAPVYDSEKEDSESDVTSFIDRHISCHVPPETEPLHEEVKLQQHKHSFSCLKQSGQKKACRFNIPKFPMSETRILTPLSLEEVSSNEKERLIKQAQAAKDLLKDLPKDTTLTHAQFLQELGCTEDDYLLCVRATLKRDELLLQRGVGETRSNAYNPDILGLWRANMDIQFVLDPYACVMYIINYVGKSQRGMSALLRNALADARKGNGSVREKLRAIANCFLNSSEISAQETCYYLLRIPVSQASRSCVFVNTGRPEKRVRMLKSEQILKEMNPDSTDVMCPGLLDKYVARPESMEGVTLAEFATDYNINSKDPGVNQPHDDEENRPNRDGNTNQRVKLTHGQGFVTKRQWSKIIRFCNFNELKDEAEYYREQVMLFHPWRNEEEEVVNINHADKFKTHEDSISQIRRKYVSSSDAAVRQALEEQDTECVNEEAIEGLVPIADLDAEELGPEEEEFQAIEDEQGRQVDVMEQVGEPARRDADVERFLAPGRIPEVEFEELLSTLNKTQSKYVMHCVNAFKTGKLPLYEFLSGGAGVGKSRLIKVIYQALIRYFGSIPGARPDDLVVLLCAPTGKAAFNIGGMSLHSALSLPLSQYSGALPSLGADVSNTLATRLHSLKLIVIDEVSMVGARMLNTISARLCQIFKTKEQFGGISVLAVGDLNQLPPVGDSFPFTCPRAGDGYAELAGPVLWNKFKLLELTEIMRQRDDLLFARALGNLVKGKMTDAEKGLLKNRQVQPEEVPEDVLHLFQTNAAVDKFNEEALSKMTTEEALCTAVDTCQGDASAYVKEQFKEHVSSLRTSETYGLPLKLTLKVMGRYMMTNNIDTADGLVNGATGRLRLIQHAQSGTERKPVRVWIEFDDPSVGSTMRGKNKQAVKNLNIPNTWTPVDPVCRVARRKQGGGNLQIMRKQFPLVPAMAITIHKSQGDTYSHVAVHLTRSIKRASLYVGCSRAKTAEGLYLVGEFRPPSEPSASDKVLIEMARLREHCPVVPCIKFLDEHVGPDLKIGFHNVQSLRKHHTTTGADTSLMAADVLCFVETRTTSEGLIEFPGFYCVFERLCLPYGTAVYVKAGIQSLVVTDTMKKISGHVEVTTVSIVKEHQHTLVTVIYKSPTTPQQVLKEVLTQTLESLSPTDRHVCLGDFNVDRRKREGDSLIELMTSNSLRPLLPPGCPTTNQGTQIDQAFANIETATAGTGESMTSYHKPVWVVA